MSHFKNFSLTRMDCRIRVFLVLVLVVHLFIVLSYLVSSPTNFSLPSLISRKLSNRSTISNKQPGNQQAFVVNTPGCKIIDMDPFNEAVVKHLGTAANPIQCDIPFVKFSEDEQNLVLNSNLWGHNETLQPSCCYRRINRVTQQPNNYTRDADWTVTFSGECQNIPQEPHGIAVNSSAHFFIVECSMPSAGEKGKPIVDFLGRVVLPKNHPSEVTRAKAKFYEERAAAKQPQPPSVLIIGIDSISRLHMIRSLPKTRHLLRRQHFVELQGYTKVGDNTFPNNMATLAGFTNGNYSSCWPSQWTKLDNCPFIWKDFASLNYVTAFLEDSPGIGAFNYEKLGFVEPPTDYYIRPLYVALHNHFGWHRQSPNISCFGGLSPTDFQVNFVKTFVEKVEQPYFLFSWLTSVAHDDFNGLSAADDTFFSLFSNVLEKDNAVVIFLSDHGYRYGDIRRSFPGFYEENLPFFFVRLPTLLQERHPKWFKNLRRNRHQLMTPLDLHSTLLQILNEAKDILGKSGDFNSGKVPVSRFRHQEYKMSYSFFEYVPPNRTCDSASIPERYCMCDVSQSVELNMTTLSPKIGVDIVDHVNHLVDPQIKNNTCLPVSFSKYVYAVEIDERPTHKDYLVAIEAIPGEGQFEAKVRVSSGHGLTKILGYVSRINYYAGQSDCISDFDLKRFCYCASLEVEKKKVELLSLIRNLTNEYNLLEQTWNASQNH